MPLFQAMGKNIVHQGGPGNGQHTKMCNQIVLAGTIIGVCESLLYGYKAGLDLDTMLAPSPRARRNAGSWTTWRQRWCSATSIRDSLSSTSRKI